MTPSKATHTSGHYIVMSDVYPHCKLCRMQAAAPDLLAACKDTLTALEDMTTADFEKGGDNVIRILLAGVISKAESST